MGIISAMNEGCEAAQPAGQMPGITGNPDEFTGVAGPADQATRQLHRLMLASAVAILIWSGIAPHDRIVWLLEVLPSLIGGAVLLATYRRFRLSNLVYLLIWCHSAILAIGGQWTYAENPIFDAIQEAFNLSRNYYDRLGHVAQGFVPAMIARELLLRTSPLRRGKWLSFIVAGLCLGVSAGYEFFEWWAAVLSAEGEAAVQFLATQGDKWDTQWDMFLCLCGAIAALLLLSLAHDRSMAGRGMSAASRLAGFLTALAIVFSAIVACYFLQAG